MVRTKAAKVPGKHWVPPRIRRMASGSAEVGGGPTIDLDGTS